MKTNLLYLLLILALIGCSNEEFEPSYPLTNIYSRFLVDMYEQRKEVYQYDKSRWIEVMQNKASGEEYAWCVYWMYEDIWQDFATLVHWEEYSHYSSPLTVQSTWKQLDDYNSEYRLLPNGILPYAGCGPVAAGQIIRYFQYPAYYDWEQMPLHKATSATSKFLLMWQNRLMRFIVRMALHLPRCQIYEKSLSR